MLTLDFAALPLTVAIVGSRTFPNCDVVRRFVHRLRPGTLVISGGARGVDAAAEEAARERGDLPPPLILRPRKETIERDGFAAAALERNVEIVRQVQDRGGIVVAFLVVPATTGGTQYTLRKCKVYTVPAMVYRMSKEGQWLETEPNDVLRTHLKWRKLLREIHSPLNRSD